MSALEEILYSINEAYSQQEGVTPVQVNASMTVQSYLSLIDSLHTESLRLADEAINAAIAAGQFVDTTATLTILRGRREQLVEMHLKIHRNLDGLGSNLTLSAAWDSITGGMIDTGDDNTGTPDDGGDDNTGNGGTGGSDNSGDDVPIVYPEPDAVVLYGDTPMLLRANDPDVVIGTAYTLDSTRLVVTSPEISINSDNSFTVGTQTGSNTEQAWSLVTNATIGGVKGLLGEMITDSGSSSLAYTYQAAEAYELATKMNEVTGKSIGFISSALEVLQGNKSFLEWNEEPNAFLNGTKNEFDAMAASALVSKIPVVGWVLSPVIDSYMKLSYKLQNTNSFEISVTADDALTGGNKGGIFLGGIQNDVITTGIGDTLASGGSGNDTFVAGSGTQYLLGAGGMDTVTFSFSGKQLNLSGTNGNHVLTSAAGTHYFSDVERIKFSDRNIALDLAPGESAANAVRLIGAALDKPALTPELVGWFINVFDQGKSMQEAIQAAMQTPQFAQFMPQLDDAAFVTTVFRNVVGVDLNKSQLDTFMGMLLGQGGAMTQTDLLVLAANTGANELNVDLAGLQQYGIDYI